MDTAVGLAEPCWAHSIHLAGESRGLCLYRSAAGRGRIPGLHLLPPPPQGPQAVVVVVVVLVWISIIRPSTPRRRCAYPVPYSLACPALLSRRVFVSDASTGPAARDDLPRHAAPRRVVRRRGGAHQVPTRTPRSGVPVPWAPRVGGILWYPLPRWGSELTADVRLGGLVGVGGGSAVRGVKQGHGVNKTVQCAHRVPRGGDATGGPPRTHSLPPRPAHKARPCPWQNRLRLCFPVLLHPKQHY